MQKKNANLKFVFIAISFILIGLYIRVKDFYLPGIWYDESLSFQTAKLPFPEMLETAKYTYSPPLWGVIVWLNLRWFGFDEVGLRSPSILFSVLSIIIVYRISSELNFGIFQKQILLISSCLLPYQIWMAQDGRVYAFLSFLFLSSIFFMLRKNWWGVMVLSVLILYSHYVGVFYLFGLYFAALIGSTSRSEFLKIIGTGVASLLAFLPWLPIYFLTINQDFIIQPLSLENFLIIFYRVAFADTLSGEVALFSVIFIGISILFISLIGVFDLYSFTKKYFLRNKDVGAKFNIQLLQFWAVSILPILAMIVWNFLWKDFIYYRLFAALSLPILIMSIFTFGKYLFSKWLRVTLTVFWTGLVFIGLANWTPFSRDGYMREGIKIVEQNWQHGDTIYHVTGTSYLPFSNYIINKPMHLLDEELNGGLLPRELQGVFGIEKLALESIDHKRVWFIYARDPQLSLSAIDRANRYVEHGNLLFTIDSWHFAPIEIYLIDYHD